MPSGIVDPNTHDISMHSQEMSLVGAIHQNPKLRYYMGYAQDAIQRTGDFAEAKEAMLGAASDRGENSETVGTISDMFDKFYRYNDSMGHDRKQTWTR